MATVILTIRRLWAQKGLSVATAVGLTAVVALMMLTPLYASGVYYQLLQDDIERVTRQTNRSAFTYFLQYQGRSRSLPWEQVAPAHEFLTGDEPALGLPVQTRAGLLVTQRFRLFRQGGQATLGRVQLAMMNGLPDNAQLVEGSWPLDAPADPAVAIEVTVSNNFAQRTGVQVGDLFTIQDEAEGGADFPLQIVGIWQPTDPRSDFWVAPVRDFENYLVLPVASFGSRIAPSVEDDVVEASWRLVLDGSGVGTDEVRSMMSRYQTVENRVATLLPAANVLQTPVEALALYDSSVTALVTLLTAFNVPIIGLVLAFIGLVVGLSVNERRNEIAVMRSRGATLLQMLTIGLLEGVVLGLIALALGTVLALWLTALIGHTRSFLDFSAESELRVVLTNGALRAGLTAVFLALLARIFPTLAAARHTIITYKQDRARAQVNPWWQRIWLDLLLMLPAAYGFYLLRQQNGLAVGGEATTFSTDPFQNPLLLILPALTIFAVTLFFLRLLPWAMRGLSWLLAQSNSVGLLLAVRQLARTPSFYATPLILLILTVSLAVFTASLARTMDLQLFDQSYYAVGADVSVYDFATRSNQRVAQSDYLFVPAATFRDLPGVLGAARVGRYETGAEIGRLPFAGIFLGVDRAELAEATFWRRDFASLPLGTLLNRLAQTPDGILLPADFMAERSLRVGDVFRQTVAVPGGAVELVGQIVGTFTYFPSWYPAEDGFLAVGNLDYLFQQVGSDLPYHVWLRTVPGVDVAALETALAEAEAGNREWATPFGQIRLAQLRPERQGLFGLLSVGFVAAALLTVFGFFLYALFSFRRRFIELGVLRAVGLGTDQMLTLLAFELGLLIVSGLGLGTGLGVLVSQGFIPYLRVGETAVPPVLVEIAWPAISQIYILFGLLFLAALVVLGGLLLRMKIFQAVKLGETI